MLKRPYEYPRILKTKIKPVLEKIAKKHSLEVDVDDIENGNFYFKAEAWRYGFEFDESDWKDFIYGIVYYEKNDDKNISKQQKEELIDILKKSSHSDWWSSWKYAEDPYRNWNEEIFKAISENPEQFGEFVESKLSEIEKALKKAGLI